MNDANPKCLWSICQWIWHSSLCYCQPKKMIVNQFLFPLSFANKLCIMRIKLLMLQSRQSANCVCAKRLCTSIFDHFFKSSNLLIFRDPTYLLMCDSSDLLEGQTSNFEFLFCHFFDWFISVHMFLFMTIFQTGNTSLLSSYVCIVQSIRVFFYHL